MYASFVALSGFSCEFCKKWYLRLNIFQSNQYFLSYVWASALYIKKSTSFMFFFSLAWISDFFFTFHLTLENNHLRCTCHVVWLCWQFVYHGSAVGFMERCRGLRTKIMIKKNLIWKSKFWHLHLFVFLSAFFENSCWL